MLSLRDEAIARHFFKENAEDFGHWTNKDEAVQSFFGVAEAAAVFVALCAALQTLGPAMENVDKIVKHTKQLIRFAKKVLSGDSSTEEIEPLELRERLLILVFDNFMRSRKGIATEHLMSLTGSSLEEAERILKRYESGGIIRAVKTGWVVVY